MDLQLSNPDRATLVKLVNNGRLASPKSKSINLNDETVKAVLAKADNITVDGTPCSVDFTVIDGVTYYRLRDLAAALTGTQAQFNVTWDDGVVITTGTAYTDAPMNLVTGATRNTVAELTATVDGAAASCTAAQVIVGDAVDGNYYVTAAGLNALTGAVLAETDGVLSITTK